MQLDTYYGDNSLHKRQYTGSYGLVGVGIPQGSVHEPLLLPLVELQGLRRKLRISSGRIPHSQERI